MSEKEQLTVAGRIADELGVRERQVTAAVELLDGGATVPFVARYRKEVTGALDDAQLRTLEERLRYLRELEERRAAVLDSVRAQGKLDPELEAQILAADSKARLEDIYLPYKPKRRTKSAGRARAGAGAAGRSAAERSDHRPGHGRAGVRDRGGAGRRGRAGGGPGDPGRTVRGGRRPGRRAARADVVPRPGGVPGAGGPRAGRDEVRGLLRVRRAAGQAAVAPDPRAVPRREGGGPRRRARPGGHASDRRGSGPVRGAHRRPVRRRRPGARGGPVAARDRAMGVADPAAGPARPRPARPAAATRGGRGDPGLRQQPA